MLIKLYAKNTDERAVSRVVDILESDGLIIYPTDGVYAFGCSMRSRKALERLKAIKKKAKSGFSIMCADLSHISDYARIDTPEFKLLRRNLPGPFTFVLTASSKVPDKVLSRRKSIGVRIADNPITQAIIEAFGQPLITSSVKSDDEITEYVTDPELIEEKYGNLVDAVVDGGYGGLVPTTVVDLTGDQPEIIREGAAELRI
ncbi:MAG: threonylcarbamoyl-AMP synthase [Alistipes sp.]|nr:threonylcarbamoyl-AMP synthase [Alistipes sp.]